MTVKPWARWTYDRVIARSGYLGRRERALNTSTVILTYHRVLPDELYGRLPLKHLATRASLFRDQIGYLASRFRCVTVSSAMTGSSPHDAADGRPVLAITFDDGTRDNAEVAAPILATAGIVATFFVVAGLVDTVQELWFERAARAWQFAMSSKRDQKPEAHREADDMATLKRWLESLKALAPTARDAEIDALARSTGLPAPDGRVGELGWVMSSDQLRALARAGHEIGSHTSTHPILTRLDDATLASELVSSRARLADAIGAPVTSIAYPNGDHDDRVVAAARRAGYTLGCTTSPGHVRTGHDPLRLPRIEPNVHRVTRRGGQLDLLALRSEIALTREVLR